MGINQPNLNGSANIPSGDKSSNTAGGAGSVNLLNVTTTGGLTGLKGAVLFFGQSIGYPNPLVWLVDPTNFNCEDDCKYHFKVEEIEVYRQPTVNKVIVRYRDLGKVTVTCFFVGNVKGESTASDLVTVTFGGKADKKIYTTTFDLTCTFEAPQLIMQRAANSGPLSVVKVLVEIIEGDAKPI